MLVVSTALCFFYLQTVCKRTLRHEFRRPYFNEVFNAIQLEYPRLRESCDSNAKINYPQACFSLKCDFVVLEYLLKNSGDARGSLPWREKILLYYFRFVLYSLSIQHAFNLREKEAILKVAAILQFFANSLGEKLSGDALVAVHSGGKK